MNRTVSTLAMLVLAACGSSTGERQAANSAEPANAAGDESPPPIPPPGTGPDARTPLTEPKGAIDPKSAEAAGQVVQHYSALIEQRRFPEAEQLWNDEGSAKDFTSDLMRGREVHLEIGKPGDMEGAAGSSYVTVPAVFYGKDSADAAFRRPAEIILRRVNDVPGSTEEQRRWHIERIDWKDN